MFHDCSLNHKTKVFRDKNGTLQDLQITTRMMKFILAFKLVRKLPASFQPVQHKLLEDISNAFYNPQIEYKDLVQKAKERTLYQGYSNEFSEMPMKWKSDPKEEKGNVTEGKNAKSKNPNVSKQS